MLGLFLEEMHNPPFPEHQNDNQSLQRYLQRVVDHKLVLALQMIAQNGAGPPQSQVPNHFLHENSS